MLKWIKSLLNDKPLSTEKPRVRFNHKGMICEMSWPEGWHKDHSKMNEWHDYSSMLVEHYNGK